MRFSRLRHRLETSADLATAKLPNTSTVTKGPRSVAPRASVPRKRKAPCASSNNNNKEGQGVSREIDSRSPVQSSNVNKRQTREKKLNYNLSALYSNDEGDNDSDGDFHADEASPPSQVDSNLSFDSEEETKPVVKRLKKQAPGDVVGANANQTSNNRKNNTAVGKSAPLAKPRLPAKQVASLKRPTTTQKKVQPNALFRPCDQLIPSIESSPPHSILSSILSSITSSILSSYDELESESDLDIKRLQPGTILSFGSGRVGSVYNTPTSKGERVHATTSPARVFSVAKTTSQASQDSAGAVLQLELKNHVQEVTPDDSVSMANNRREGLGPTTPPSMAGE